MLLDKKAFFFHMRHRSRSSDGFWIAAFSLTVFLLSSCTRIAAHADRKLGIGSQPFSADGQSLLVSIARQNTMDLYQVTRDGTLTRLTSQGANFDGSYAPDGSKIVFSSTAANPDSTLYERDTTGTLTEDSREADLFVMNANGSSRVRLTNSPEHDTAPIFIADGQRICFRRSRFYRPVYAPAADSNWWDTDIYTIKTNGSDLVRLTQQTSAEASPPSIAPNGQYVIVDLRAWRSADDPLIRNRHEEGFWLITLVEPYPMTRLTPDLKSLLTLSGRYHADEWSTATGIQHPVFSPDGTSILFALHGCELYIMSREHAAEVKRIAAGTRPYRDMAFSPDGREIAFVHSQPGFGVPDELWIMSSNGTQVRQIDVEL